MPLPEGPHLDRLREALAIEGRGQAALLAGDDGAAHPLFAEAARLYRASWEAAPPGSYGRLIGMLKAAVIAGQPEAAADYALDQVPEDAGSPPAAYARAIASLVAGDDAVAAAQTGAMRTGSPAFARAADAVAALAARDPDAHARAVGAIIEDFEGRDEHLTGVAIADTAVMFDRLAASRGMAPASVASPLMPG